MLVYHPVPFSEAIRLLRAKEALPTSASAAQLERLGADLKRYATFLAKTRHVGILKRVDDLVAQIVSPEGRGPGEYMNTPRFIEEMRKLLESIGHTPEPGKEGSIEDLASEGRQRLIVETQVRVMHGYGQFLQRNSAVDAFPAQELFRLSLREKPRPWAEKWAAAGGRFFGGRMIALVNDPIWTLSLDDGGFNRFGNPYPPFDYNSGMWVRPISRGEAVQFGLIARGEKVEPHPAALAENARAQVDHLPGSLRAAILKSIGDGASIDEKGVLHLANEVIELPNHPGQPRDSLGRWVDENGGGLSERDNIARGHRAVRRALKKRRDVPKAMYRRELGRVDFIWGTPGAKAENYEGGFGISHIEAKHGRKDAKRLPVVLARGKVMRHPEGPSKRLIRHDNFVASVVKEKSRSAWVLTGFTRR